MFIGDYLLAIIVFLNFASFRAAEVILGKPLRALAKPIRWAASFTLSIYLFHKPLLLFYTALLHGDPRGLYFYFSVLAMVLVTIFGLATVTEHQKDRYRRVFIRVLAIGEQFIRIRFPRLLPHS
jgi:peptidoglycan/LPS O-acetylase OafA/YrhL